MNAATTNRAINQNLQPESKKSHCREEQPQATTNPRGMRREKDNWRQDEAKISTKGGEEKRNGRTAE